MNSLLRTTAIKKAEASIASAYISYLTT